MSIPDSKLQEICKVCDNWSDKRTVKNDLQSLIYITKIMKLARYFFNCMLQLLRDNTDKHHIFLTEEFFKDL